MMSKLMEKEIQLIKLKRKRRHESDSVKTMIFFILYYENTTILMILILNYRLSSKYACRVK